MEGPLRTVRLRELLVGVEGLALLRRLFDGTDDEADARLAEVRRILTDDAFEAGEPTTESDAKTGYGAWAERYDDPGNLIIAIEEPVVHALVDGIPPGRAIDAACGTGRHTRHLVARGHTVTGVDLSPEMLAKATGTGATLALGDLLALPARDASADLVVCGLAIAHVADLERAVAELARVLRPGGRLVLSALHPFQAHLGWHAPFESADGQRGYVREHAHTHADYLAAFRAAGLTIADCVEPPLTAATVESKRRAFRHIPEATVAAYEGLPAVLVWAATRSS